MRLKNIIENAGKIYYNIMYSYKVMGKMFN